jgi:sugar/nucleoside kinase (ribokinase family)
LIPAVLRQKGINIVTLDPGKGYMYPEFWNLIPSLVSGLDVFIPAEEDLRKLFKGRSEDILEMGEAMADWGCEIIVIKRAEKGQLLFDYGARRKYEISAYPSKMVDLTGAGDIFCGGFLAGYCKTYDPLQAVLYGNVTASIAVEGTGAFYTRDVLPGLKEARLENIKAMIREV